MTDEERHAVAIEIAAIRERLATLEAMLAAVADR